MLLLWGLVQQFGMMRERLGFREERIEKFILLVGNSYPFSGYKLRAYIARYCCIRRDEIYFLVNWLKVV